MELEGDNLVTLSEYLKATLNPAVDVRRPGEFNLKNKIIHICCITLRRKSQNFSKILYVTMHHTSRMLQIFQIWK